MIAEKEISVPEEKKLRVYKPEDGRDYLLQEVILKYDMSEKNCDGENGCHDCDFFLSVISNPLYPYNHCNIDAYSDESLRELLKINPR